MLGPLAAQLQQAGSRTRLVALVHVLCSASGTRTWSADADGTLKQGSAGDDSRAQVGHCPVCASSALGPALTSTRLLLPLAVVREGHAPRFYSAPGPSPIWRAGLSRGPPFQA